MSDYHHDVPKLLASNLEFRLKIAKHCRFDRDARSILRQAASEDLLFFVNAFCWTLDPRKLSSNSRFAGASTPFITWAYQDDALLTMDYSLEQAGVLTAGATAPNMWLPEHNGTGIAKPANMGVEGGDVLIEKSRDMGASWLVCVWFLWRWLFRDYQSFLMVSRKESLVDGDDDSLFSHIDFMLKRLPRWLVPAGSFSRTSLYLKNLQNDSVIEGESTTDNIGRGGRRTVILLDEFPAFEGGGYTALSATADTTNCRLMNGTPRGTANAFYAQREKGTRRIRMHWSQHPEKRRGLYRPLGAGQYEKLDAAFDYTGLKFVDEVPRGEEGLRSPWYDEQCRRRAHPWEIAQELDIDYKGSNYPFFDPQFLENLRIEFCRPATKVGRIEKRARSDGEEYYVFVDDPRGYLSLWCELVARLGSEWSRPPGGRDYVIGIDTSHGVGSSDSAASVTDLLSGVKVGELVHNRWGINVYAGLLCDLGYFFTAGGAPAYLIWEATGPGRTLGKIIAEDLKYPRYYTQRDERSHGAIPTQKYGWYSSLDGKRDLLQTYRELLTAKTFINPSAEAIREAGFYAYVGGRIEWQGPTHGNDQTNVGVNHGDRVTADALCAKIMFEWKGGGKSAEASQITVDAPVLSIAWRNENWQAKVDEEALIVSDREH